MIIGLFPELTSPGGVQRAGRLTAAVLSSFAARRGHSCEFLSLNDPPESSPFQLGLQQIEFQGFGRSKALFLKSAWLAARREPALVLALHPNLAPIAAAMKLRNPATRVVVFAHGIEVWSRLPLVRRRSLRYSDLVFAPSTDTARHLVAQQGVAPEKITKLPWSLGPEFNSNGNKLGKPELPVGFPLGKVILTVGRWDAGEAYKGADHLIEALPSLLRSCPDLHLVAVGSGSDVPRLKSLAEKSGVSSRVHFLSSLSNEHLAAAYEACDLFALPSRGEGFGLVFLEAMSHGKPVIGGAHGGTPDIVEDGVNGFLVPYGDLPQITEKTALLLKDGLRRAAMGAKALETVRNRYTFDLFRNTFEKTLDGLLTPSSTNVDKNKRY